MNQTKIRHSSLPHWRNSNHHIGVACIVRDHNGMVLFHAREAMTGSTNRIFAELRWLIWAMPSLLDLRVADVTFAFDCRAMFEAISKLAAWPRYYNLIQQVEHLCRSFTSCGFQQEKPKSNVIARAISKSVTRDRWFQSYLSRRGPSKLHDAIVRESL